MTPPMPTEDVVRSYEIRVSETPELTQLLADTQKFYTTGAGRFTNLVLTMHGAATVEWAKFPIFTTYSSGTKASKKRDDKTESYSPAVHLFFHWFTRENPEDAPDGLVIANKAELRANYVRNCRANAIQPDDTILHLIDHSDYDNMPGRPATIWVDRHRAFKQLCKAVGDGLETLVPLLVAQPTYPVGEDSKASAIGARNMISTLWGEPAEAKTNWSHTAKVWRITKGEFAKGGTKKQIAGRILRALGLEPKTVLDEIKEASQGGKEGASVSLKKAMSGRDFAKSGRSDRLYLFLANNCGGDGDAPLTDKELKLWAAECGDRVAQCEVKAALAAVISPALCNKLLGTIDHDMPIKLLDGDRRNTDQYAAMLSAAFAKVGAYKKQCLNQYDRRKEHLVRQVEARAGLKSVPPAFIDAVGAYRHKALVSIIDSLDTVDFGSAPGGRPVPRPKSQFYFSRRMAADLDYVVKVIAGAKNPLGAYNLFAERTRLHGDHNLYVHLVQHVPSVLHPDLEKHMGAVIEYDEASAEVNCLRNPMFRHYGATNAFFPYFGSKDGTEHSTSMPFGRVAKPTLQAHVPPGDVNGWGRRRWKGGPAPVFTNQIDCTLELLKDGKLQRVPFQSHGKRVVVELLQVTGDVVATRNHALTVMQHGGQAVRSNVKNLALMPILRDGKYYIKVAATVGAPSVPKTKELVELPSLRVMGVDIGWRNESAAAVMEVSKFGQAHAVKATSGKTTVYFRPCKSVPLELDVVGRGNVLMDNSRPVEPHEYQPLLGMAEQCGVPCEPRTLSQLQYVAAQVLQRAARNLKDGHAAAQVEELWQQVMMIYFGNQYVWAETAADKSELMKQPQHNRQAGGLSAVRIENLSMLVSAMQSFRKKCDNLNKQVHGLAKQIDRVRLKLIAVRRERTRTLANRVVMAAIQTGAKVIVVEELDTGRTDRNDRKINARMRQWCHNQTVELVKQYAAFQGLYVKEVRPFMTNRLDWTQEATPGVIPNHWRRFRIVTPSDVERLGLKNSVARYLAEEPRRKKSTEHKFVSITDVLREFCHRHGLPLDAEQFFAKLFRADHEWTFGNRVGYPDLSGNLFVRSQFGTTPGLPESDKMPHINANINAAMVVAVRGGRFLHGILGEKKPAKAAAPVAAGRKRK